MDGAQAAFDDWIRHRFPEINTELEEHYFANIDNPGVDAAAIEQLQHALLSEGRSKVTEVVAENALPTEFTPAFYLLGNVGLFMAACRRHDISDQTGDTQDMVEASALALNLGASQGVAPRFVASHMSTHNRAEQGQYRVFTNLHDEAVFIDYNTRGIFAYKKAADALVRAAAIGATHPLAMDLFADALAALECVLDFNLRLVAELDVRRFFYCVRPYYKTYKVGQRHYRGANAGDFAGINEIDLLLGLCSANDPFYQEVLADKNPFMVPADQERIRQCIATDSLLDQFLGAAGEAGGQNGLQRNAKAFLDVCRAHGAAAAVHHDQLVKKFIEVPAEGLPASDHEDLTASGPPLEVLLRSLEKLRDLRLAAARADIRSRHADIARLRAGVSRD